MLVGASLEPEQFRSLLMSQMELDEKQSRDSIFCNLEQAERQVTIHFDDSIETIQFYVLPLINVCVF